MVKIGPVGAFPVNGEDRASFSKDELVPKDLRGERSLKASIDAPGRASSCPPPTRRPLVALTRSQDIPPVGPTSLHSKAVHSRCSLRHRVSHVVVSENTTPSRPGNRLPGTWWAFSATPWRSSKAPDANWRRLRSWCSRSSAVAGRRSSANYGHM